MLSSPKFLYLGILATRPCKHRMDAAENEYEPYTAKRVRTRVEGG